MLPVQARVDSASSRVAQAVLKVRFAVLGRAEEVNPPDLARFETFFEPVTETGCWLWTGTLTGHKTQYGMFSAGSHQRLAHRISYEHFVGLIPDGYEVDHKCRVRCCVNPAHLQVVTPEENRRLMTVRRTHCRNGHPLNGIDADIRMDKTRYGGYARICRVCMRANMERFKAKPGNLEAMRAYWRKRDASK
jgi:hypothetical protein